MLVGQNFKLEKLKIYAFTDKARQQNTTPEYFEAMFNPTSIKQKYSARYAKSKGQNGTDQQSTYILSEPSALKLSLLLDGTGVSESSASGESPSVSSRVNTFLKLAYQYNGDIHRPNWLRVQWGDLWDSKGFNCRLEDVEITYNRFDHAGKPLRATLDITLKSDASLEEQAREKKATSPDLTHRRTVVAGDTLPLLSQQIYGSPQHVAFIARSNQLDSLRVIEPGTELIFPPLPSSNDTMEPTS